MYNIKVGLFAMVKSVYIRVGIKRNDRTTTRVFLMNWRELRPNTLIHVIVRSKVKVDRTHEGIFAMVNGRFKPKTTLPKQKTIRHFHPYSIWMSSHICFPSFFLFFALSFFVSNACCSCADIY